MNEFSSIAIILPIFYPFGSYLRLYLMRTTLPKTIISQWILDSINFMISESTNLDMIIKKLHETYEILGSNAPFIVC